MHEAEAALAADDPGRADGPSAVAHHIARRPFLPGAEGPWVDGRRARLRSILLRAHAASGNAAEALRAYERCRRLIAEELGVDPSRRTKAEYEAVLASL